MFSQNNNLEYGEAIASELAELLNDGAVAEARQAFLAFFDNLETPLVSLPGLAAKLGVGEVHVKDESGRLGLASFKALGGAYAVLRLVQEESARRLRRPVSARELLTEDVKAVARRITVCCATDGNHGRAVAMGANLVGAKAIVYLHAGVSEARERAIQEAGAKTVRVKSGYDASVRLAAQMAAACGWTLVSDTSWPGNERMPSAVMQAYAVIAAEIAARVAQPTHIFLQAGVGALAAAIAGYYASRHFDRRPCFVVVEPQRAACLFESNRAGRRVAVKPGPPTIMAMLECYEPSHLAWRILSRTADFFMTVDEEDACAAMRQLAFPLNGDPAIVSGESGCVGLAALQVVNAQGHRRSIGLDESSRVVILNTEGATDPFLYESIVGASACKTADDSTIGRACGRRGSSDSSRPFPRGGVR
jgi:diaminopropionate ammonia-lyase